MSRATSPAPVRVSSLCRGGFFTAADEAGIAARAGAGGGDAAGYRGPIEVEVFNQRVWDTPGDDVLRLLRARFAEHVLD